MSEEKPKSKKDSEPETKQNKAALATKKKGALPEDGKKHEGEKTTPRNCMTLVAYVSKLRKLKYSVIKFGGGSKTYISDFAIRYAVKLTKAAAIIAKMNRRVTILEKDVISALKIVQSPFGYYDKKTFFPGTTPKYKRTNIKPRKTSKKKVEKETGPKNAGVKKPTKGK